MQVLEIRWATDHPVNESQRSRMPVGRGVTFINGEAGDFASSLFTRLQFKLTHASGAPISEINENDHDLWQFVFQKDGNTVLYSTDQEDRGWEHYFRQSLVGRESELLGSQLDLGRLADRNLTGKAKKIYIESLLGRYIESHTHLFGTGRRQGYLASLLAELSECEREIEHHKSDVVSDRNLALAIEDKQQRLADLKAEDLRLAQDQRQGKLLAMKAEYESLLNLRGQLRETEEREGAYGSRITNLGHNITVHELTDLARVRIDVQEIENEANLARDELDQKRKEKMTAEQERILLARQINDLQEQKKHLEHELDVHPLPKIVEIESDQDRVQATFPTSNHLIILFSLLLFSAGLLLTLFYTTPGIVLIGVSLLIAIVVPVRKLLSGYEDMRQQRGVLNEQAEHDNIQEEIRYIDSLISSSLVKLAEYGELIEALEQEDSQLGIRVEMLNRNLRYTRADLLRSVSQYAGPSEIDEIDDIIITLSRQRDSSAKYNETVSDLLRRIAELKHGRSDDEMLREYENVCQKLYGDFNCPGQSDNSVYTKELFYDPERMRQISDQRTEIGGRIDKLSTEIRDEKSILKVSREASVTIGSLDRKRDALQESVFEARNDLLRLSSAIAWLEELLASWTEIDVMLCMARTAGYITRLMGRRSGKTLQMEPVSAPGIAMRTPKSLDLKAIPESLTETIDDSIFLSSPSELRYMAFRLALSSLQGQQQTMVFPLIWMNPKIPDEYSLQDELVSTLEEWTLETGRQVIYFTHDPQLTEIAKTRKMKVYDIG